MKITNQINQSPLTCKGAVAPKRKLSHKVIVRIVKEEARPKGQRKRIVLKVKEYRVVDEAKAVSLARRAARLAKEALKGAAE